MATFSKDVVLVANPVLISEIASQMESEFLRDGFEVHVDRLSSGGADISISKGGTFKAVLGMKTALKIALTPQLNSIHFIADVGIFGQQVLPAIIMWFYLWPVLLTQIWGLVQQAQLDDKALDIANRVIAEHTTSSAAGSSSCAKFCPNCGSKLGGNAKFCPECGTSLS